MPKLTMAPVPLGGHQVGPQAGDERRHVPQQLNREGLTMDLIPENHNGAVVFNLISTGVANRGANDSYGDFAVAIHNYLMNSEVRYLLLDFQDEKEICANFLEELMQLAKRLRVPFLLVGVMEKPRRILESYDFTRRWPLFLTPEEAVAYLNANYPEFLQVSLAGLEFGTAIASSRNRAIATPDGESVEADAVE